MNRKICFDASQDVATYEADTKHRTELMTEFGMKADSKGVATPLVKVVPTPQHEVELDDVAASSYRSSCMRMAYLALDRPELQYASKECARGMKTPTVRHAEMLKRAVRFLAGQPRCVWNFKRQRWPKRLFARSDTDWAGCPVSRKSTNGTAITCGLHTWFTQSSTQVPISSS